MSSRTLNQTAETRMAARGLRLPAAALIALALSGCTDNSVSGPAPAPDLDDDGGGPNVDAGESSAGSGGSGSGHGGHAQAGSGAGTGGADGSAGSGPPPAAGGTGEGFAQNIHPMLVMTCSSCHAGMGTGGAITPHQGSGPGEFAVDDVESAYEVALKYVVPGSPEASKLYIKISQDMPSTGGQRMPPLLPMPEQQIELVRAWIAAGAPPD